VLKQPLLLILFVQSNLLHKAILDCRYNIVFAVAHTNVIGRWHICFDMQHETILAHRKGKKLSIEKTSISLMLCFSYVEDDVQHSYK
jgi:hypothetical protein